MAGRHFLQIPGPSAVPDRILRAIDQQVIDHRGPEFGPIGLKCLEGMKRIFQTKGDVVIYPASGTGAWEAALVNTCSPGDKVLMARHGQFSALWVEMAQRLGLEVEVIDVAWGAPCPAKEFSRRLGNDRHDEIKAVFVTHNETATGVRSDVAAVRRALDESFHDALLFVDGVSSIGSMDFRMDDWGVDLAITGTQKGLMCPAGAGILCASDKAMALSKISTMRRAYFEFADMVAMNATVLNAPF